MKAFLSPRGRRPRLLYWRAAALVPLLALLALIVVTVALKLARPSPYIAVDTALTFVHGLTTLAVVVTAFWSGLAVAIQRLHDRDRSGWWALIALVPIVGSIWYLFWNGLRPGTPGPNRFGADPLTPNAAVAAVFGDVAAPEAMTPPRRQPIASTIILWLVLLAILLLDAFFLFQNPGRRPQRPEAPPPPSIER